MVMFHGTTSYATVGTDSHLILAFYEWALSVTRKKTTSPYAHRGYPKKIQLVTTIHQSRWIRQRILADRTDLKTIEHPLLRHSL